MCWTSLLLCKQIFSPKSVSRQCRPQRRSVYNFEKRIVKFHSTEIRLAPSSVEKPDQCCTRIWHVKISLIDDWFADSRCESQTVGVIMIHLRQNVGCLGYVDFSFSHLHILSCLHSTPPIFLKMFRQQFWDQKDVDLNRFKLDPIIPPCPHNFLNKCQGLLSINVETCACPVRKGTNCGNHKTSYPVSKIINKMQNPGGLEHARNLPFKYPHLKKRNPNVPCQFHVWKWMLSLPKAPITCVPATPRKN